MLSSTTSQGGSSESINTGVTLPSQDSNHKVTATASELSPNANANNEAQVEVEAEASLQPSPIHSPPRSVADLHLTLRHQDRLLADRAAEITYLRAAQAAELHHLRASHEVLRLQSEMRENELLYSLDVQEVFKLRGERLNEDLLDENNQQRRAIEVHEAEIATLQRENSHLRREHSHMRRNNQDLYLIVANIQASFLNDAEIENSRGVGYTHNSVRGFCWELSGAVKRLEDQLEQASEELQTLKDRPVQVHYKLQDRCVALEDENRELQKKVEHLEDEQKAQEGKTNEEMETESDSRLDGKKGD